MEDLLLWVKANWELVAVGALFILGGNWEGFLAWLKTKLPDPAAPPSTTPVPPAVPTVPTTPTTPPVIVEPTRPTPMKDWLNENGPAILQFLTPVLVSLISSSVKEALKADERN